ncbi:MAG: alanine dehydrogenase, partial [bacterium]|nr:alanine dehydrogenase [bacterium]
MIVGVPKEIKADENRVALLPVGAERLVQSGHRVLVESQAGRASGATDDEYVVAGAQIVDTAEEVYGESELIVKVKEPLSAEYGLLRKGQVVFCYFHFAASRELTETVLNA